MQSLRFEQDFKLLESKYRFKKFSKLCTYMSSREALQKRYFTLFEILDTLRIILRTEGHYSKKDPWHFLCPKVAYYDKTYFLDLEADTLDLGSLDHEKEKCFWNFFHILQNTPYQVQITFCNLYSGS